MEQIEERSDACRAIDGPPGATRYRVFGLSLEFDISCQGLVDLRDLNPHLEAGVARPVDVRIACGEIPATLGGPGALMPGFHPVDNGVLLHVAGVARYLVSGGSAITVAPAPGASPDAVSVFLLGSAIGAVLHQRGVLPLHASAVALPGCECALFLGPSGAGKSTLTMALARRGYPVVADDVTVVVMEESGIPRVQLGIRRAKLWEDSATTLGVDIAESCRVMPHLNKYRVSPGGRAVACDALDIRRVFVLRTGETNHLHELMPGLERARVLLQNTYRPQFVRFGSRTRHLQLCIEVAERTAIRRLTRSSNLSQLGELIDLVETEI